MPKNFNIKNNISLKDFVVLCRTDGKIVLDASQKKKIKSGRERIEKLIKKGARVYGVNTGFGALAKEIINESQIDELQLNLIRSHACGVGEPFPPEIAKGMILLLINSLSKGYSGVRFELVEALVKIFNANAVPVIPSKGSVGASGDLVPLAHLALALIGEGEFFYKNKRQPSKIVLEKIGLKPFRPKAKEGLALLNGTHAMVSSAAFCIDNASNLLETADIAAAMSLEALKGTDAFLKKELHLLKPHLGQLQTAENLRKFISGSEIIASHKNCGKVQDVYSLRCIPQVHGASRDAVSYAKKIIETEMNSVTDNPLIFENGQAVSGGNFHGQPIALAMDFLGIALSEIADISERRVGQLMDFKTSGLPPFLIKNSGLNSGFMISQYTAASLVSYNKVLSHPASVDSIPTSANIEDHVSMGSIACHKAREICDNALNVLAIELLCAAQALDFHKPLRSGRGINAAHRTIRKAVPFLKTDAVLSNFINKISLLIKNGTFVKEVENSAGKIKL